MKRWKEVFYQKGKTYQENVFLWCRYSKETEGS